MSNNVTETLDKLYLEWSQFTTARNAREIAMAATIADLTAQRDALISDVVRMEALYDKCAAKDATIADLTEALQQIDNLKLETWAILEAAKIARAALAGAQRREPAPPADERGTRKEGW